MGPGAEPALAGMSSQSLDLDDLLVRLERTSAEDGVAASDQSVFFIQRWHEHENVESGCLEVFLRFSVRMVAVVSAYGLDVVRAAGVVVVNRGDLTHELLAVEQRSDELCVNLETRSVGEVQAVFPALWLRHLLADFGEIGQSDLHSTEHFVSLFLRGAIDAELETRLSVVDLVLDLAPLQDSLLESLELPRRRSGKNGMDDFNSQSGIRCDLPLVGVEPASKLEDGLVENRITHSRVVQIQSLRVLDLREQADGVVELRLQVLEGCVAVPLDIRNIAEGAPHRTAVLRADRDDPLFREGHAIGVQHAFDVLAIAEEIGFDIVGLAVVANRKRLKRPLGIVAGEEIAGRNRKPAGDAHI